MYLLVCKQCGREFSRKKSTVKFCSRECYRKYCSETNCLKGKTSSKVEVHCAFCNKQEMVPPSRAATYKCCSKECIAKYHAKQYNKQVSYPCPICGTIITCKRSKVSHYRTCGSPICRKVCRSQTRKGKNNSHYKTIDDLVKQNAKRTDLYRYIVRDYFKFPNIRTLPKNYCIHHKDCNHSNQDVSNLVVLPRSTHRLIHTIFGNVLISALHTNKISRELFQQICSEEQWEFYRHIIDLNITNQVVVKQGELLENPEVGNQQPSIYRNIYIGSETNDRVLASKVEDSNVDTSALPVKNSDDIVRTACITYEDAEL